jgi:hypothetical protein
MIKTETFLLPVHWASYLIDGDASGYTDEEIAEIDEWETAYAPGPCIDAGADNDLSCLGDDGLGVCLRAVFTFQVFEACFADGEPITWH